VVTAPSPHTLRHGKRLENGDTELECFCGATFAGPEGEALAAFQLHMFEPVMPEGDKP
jgi:hypothetical protein